MSEKLKQLDDVAVHSSPEKKYCQSFDGQLISSDFFSSVTVSARGKDVYQISSKSGGSRRHIVEKLE